MYISRNGFFQQLGHYQLSKVQFLNFSRKNCAGSYAFTAAVNGYGQTGEIGLSILLNGKPGVSAFA